MELCLMRPGRKKRDPPTIQVIEKLTSLMSTRITIETNVENVPMVTIYI